MYLCVCLFSLAGTLNSSFKTQLSTFISYQIVSYLERATITHGQVGEGRGMQPPPLWVKNKSPTLWQKNGYPSKKIHGLIYGIPLFWPEKLSLVPIYVLILQHGRRNSLFSACTAKEKGFTIMYTTFYLALKLLPSSLHPHP